MHAGLEDGFVFVVPPFFLNMYVVMAAASCSIKITCICTCIFPVTPPLAHSGKMGGMLGGMFGRDTVPSHQILPSQKTEFMWINVKKNGSTNMRFWNGMSNAIRTVGCHTISCTAHVLSYLRKCIIHVHYFISLYHVGLEG